MDIIEKAAHDGNLDLTDLGILVRFFFDGPMNIQEAETLYEIGYLDHLSEMGYIECDETNYFIFGTSTSDAELLEMWKVFYKAYPGHKSGVNVELKNVQTRYPKNKWKDIVRILSVNLKRQIQERQILTDTIASLNAAGQKNHGLFVPPWKNMQTYFSKTKQAWLESWAVPEEYQQKKQAVTASADTQKGEEYTKYYDWALNAGKGILPNEISIINAMLDEREYLGMMLGTLGTFKDWTSYTTFRALKLSLIDWQMEYFSTLHLRQKHPRCFDYCESKFNEDYRNT